ncbi:MAG: ABC transporter permease [Chloroflexota bacterium]
MLMVILRRVAMMPPSLLGVSIVIFLLLNVLPGDPLAGLLAPDATQKDREELAQRMGLSDPLPVQYVTWMGNVLQGDLGWSFSRRRPIAELVWTAFGNTVILAAAAATIGIAAGVGLGLAAALRPGGPLDRAVSGFAMVGLSVPNYWLAILLIIAFSATLQWLPAAGMYGPEGGLLDLLAHLLMPSLATAAVSTGLIARMTRSSILETFGEDFVMLLRAKGLSDLQILRHVLVNAAPPIMTVAGLQVGFLLGGSVLVETIFSWPGLGQLIFQSISTRDLRLIQASVLVIAVTFVTANLLIDVLQALVNPRLRRAL